MGQRLSGRRLRRLALAAVGLVAVGAVLLPVGASMAPAQGTPSSSSYRLTLVPDDPGPGRDFTARLDRSVDGGRSWKAAGGQTLTFAFVGEGSITAISGAGRGLSCTTSAAGTCTVTVESPGDSLLSASFEDLTANALV